MENMIVEISEETIDKIRELTNELFTLIHDEVEEQTGEVSGLSMMFCWYQIVIQAVQYILKDSECYLEPCSRAELFRLLLAK